MISKSELASLKIETAKVSWVDTDPKNYRVTIDIEFSKDQINISNYYNRHIKLYEKYPEYKNLVDACLERDQDVTALTQNLLDVFLKELMI